MQVLPQLAHTERGVCTGVLSRCKQGGIHVGNIWRLAPFLHRARCARSHYRGKQREKSLIEASRGKSLTEASRGECVLFYLFFLKDELIKLNKSKDTEFMYSKYTFILLCI